MCSWPSGRGASLPSWTGQFDSRRALWIGDRLTAGRLPLKQEMMVRVHLPEYFPFSDARSSNGRTRRSERLNVGSIPALAVTELGPVVQRQRLLAYTQATMVQVHPGLLRLGTPTGRAARLKPTRLPVRLRPWVVTIGQSERYVLAEQPSVLATLSRWSDQSASVPIGARGSNPVGDA
jgi:hypothetical protein